jgi:hypothetical protein
MRACAHLLVPRREEITALLHNPTPEIPHQRHSKQGGIAAAFGTQTFDMSTLEFVVGQRL